jgi:hypothetical protein
MSVNSTEQMSGRDQDVAVLRVELGQIAQLTSGTIQNISTQKQVNEAIVSRLLTLEAQIRRLEANSLRQQ